MEGEGNFKINIFGERREDAMYIKPGKHGEKSNKKEYSEMKFQKVMEVLGEGWRTLSEIRTKGQRYENWRGKNEKKGKSTGKSDVYLIGIPQRDIYGNGRGEITEDTKEFPRTEEYTFLDWKGLLSAITMKKDLQQGMWLCNVTIPGGKRGSERREKPHKAGCLWALTVGVSCS